MQNIIIIPCMIAIAVSGMKLYASIAKDKRKENIKLEVVRHTIFSICMCIGLVIASFIEAYVSSNLMMMLANYL